MASRLVQMMSEEARDLTSNYIDDFVVSGQNFEAYMRNTENFFSVCKEMGMTLSPKKTKLGFPTAKLLGRQISKDKIVVHEDNLQPLRNSVEPTGKTELKSFLGTCQYAARHVRNYSALAHNLNRLLRKGTLWDFNEQRRKEYHKLKEAVLKGYPLVTPDYSKPF